MSNRVSPEPLTDWSAENQQHTPITNTHPGTSNNTTNSTSHAEETNAVRTESPGASPTPVNLTPPRLASPIPNIPDTDTPTITTNIDNADAFESEYQRSIARTPVNEEVEPAARYDPPDLESQQREHAERRSSQSLDLADENQTAVVTVTGGFSIHEGEIEDRYGDDKSDPLSAEDNQRIRHQQEAEKERERQEQERRAQAVPLALFSATGGEQRVATTSSETTSEINDYNNTKAGESSSFEVDNNYDSPRKLVGRLPPLGHSPTGEGEGNFERIDTLPRSKMSARPNSGISRKDQDGVIGANDNQEDSGCCAIILTILSYILVILFFPFSLCLTIKVVQEYERAVIFRLGRLLPGGAKGPGIFFVMPCIEEYTKVDLRTVSFDVPPQEVLTRDSVTVSVDAVVYYRISNPTVSVANVENAANSTQLLAQTTLRNVLGTQNLAEILSNREHISEQMQNVLDDATDKWGIKVERVEIKDVRLPTQLQRAMAAEAEAARDARAKVIAAEGEQKASVALKEAADIITDSPAALQLRYLQTLNSISAEKNSTIIFPLPIEMVSGLLKK